jgi:MFS family permease
MAVFLLCAAFSSFCLSRCPTSAIHPDPERTAFSGLRYIRTDRVFRQTLISWMILGFANLMLIPLRVDYLANPKYGLNLSTSQVALLIGVIPNLARFFLAPFWGSLFDRVNFFMLRICVNMGFAIGILSFFMSDAFPGLVFGAVLFGISVAGGDVAFAPAGRVAEYMAIHSFFTGVRGIIAPFAGFYLAQELSLATLAAISTGLIVLASALLIPEYRLEKVRLRA